MSIFVSLLTAGSNSHQESSENFNAEATDFLTPGVIGALTNTSGVSPATGGFAINAQGSPNMTVAVSSGVAWATGTPSSQNSQTMRVRNTASVNVTISANASGSTKYDWVYLSLNATKMANPAVDASDVATLVTSRSSSNTTDNGSPPTFGLNLGYVTVANGASSITNGNITDRRVNAASGVQAGSLVVPQSGTGVAAIVQAAGTDTDISLKLLPKGAGTLNFGTTGISGLIAVGSNAGTAGGSTNFLNLGGWKICWGETGSQSINALGQANLGVTFPTTFTSAPTMIVGGADFAGTPNQFVFRNAAPSTTAGVISFRNFDGATNGTGLKAIWVAFGT